MSLSRRAVALAVLPAVLAACGGGGGGEGAPSASPAAPADHRLTLAQYTPRGAPQPLSARAEEATDYLFATEWLARGVGASNASAFVLPPLALGQRALLIEAAEGAALASLMAERADLRGLAAPVRERTLSAASAERFVPGWLQASEAGSAHAPAPLKWQAQAAAAAAPGSVPDGFSLTLTVSDRLSTPTAWPGAVQAFDGVLAFDGGGRQLTRLLRLHGEVWQLDAPLLRAQGLRWPDGTQLVKLRPTVGSARDVAADALRLSEILTQLNQRLRSGVAVAPGSVVLGDVAPSFVRPQDEKGQIGSPQSLAFAKLNGAGQYVEYERSSALSWTASALNLWGEGSLRFIGRGSSPGNSGGGGGFSNGTLPLAAACPAGTDLQPEILLGLDAQGRLVWLAYAATQGTALAPCL